MRLTMLTAMILLAGCAGGGVDLPGSPDGHHALDSPLMVMQKTDGCTVVGHVIGKTYIVNDRKAATARAISNARSKARSMGANAIFYETTWSRIWGTDVLAKALQCPAHNLETDQLTARYGAAGNPL